MDCRLNPSAPRVTSWIREEGDAGRPCLGQTVPWQSETTRRDIMPLGHHPYEA